MNTCAGYSRYIGLSLLRDRASSAEYGSKRTRTRQRRFSRLIAFSLPVVTVLLMAALFGTARAATFTPTDVNGLIAAINTANSNSAQSNTIVLDGGITYTLSQPYAAGNPQDPFDPPNGNKFDPPSGACQGNALPTITRPLIIEGNGAVIKATGSGVYVSTGKTPYTNPTTNQFRVFSVSVSGSLTLNRVLVTGGTGQSAGGAVCNAGTLVIRNSTITNSRNYPPIETFTATPPGAPLMNNGYGEGFGGGGIANLCNASLTIENSTISYNLGYGTYGGGAILNYGNNKCTNFANSSVTIIHSTLFENQADHLGAAGGHGDTITSHGWSPITLKNSILANPSVGKGDVCYLYQAPNTNNGSPVKSSGNNLIVRMGGTSNQIEHCQLGYWWLPSSTQKQTAVIASDKDVDPKLAGWTGKLRVHIPTIGSPAIDQVPKTMCNGANNLPLATDQIGTARPQGVGCEIGAIELAAQPPPTSALNIHKHIDGCTPVFPNSRFDFHVTCRDVKGNVTLKSPTAVKISGCVDNVAVVKVPSGAICDVVEVPPTVPLPAPYSWAVPTYKPTSKSLDGTQITCKPPAPCDVYVTNKLTSGVLQIGKQVVDKSGLFAGDAFTFGVMCTGPGSGQQYSQKLLIKLPTINNSLKDSQSVAVPLGATCTVTEIPPTPIPGTTWAAPSFSHVNGQVVITAPGPTVVVTNELSRTGLPAPMSTVQISKDINIGKGSVSVTLVCGTTTYGPYSLVVPTGNKSPVIQVPTGSACTVTETKLFPVAPPPHWLAKFFYGSPTPLAKCVGDPFCANVVIAPGASTIAIVNTLTP